MSELTIIVNTLNSSTTLVMVGLDEISANADNIRRASDKQAPGGAGYSYRHYATFRAADYAPLRRDRYLPLHKTPLDGSDWTVPHGR